LKITKALHIVVTCGTLLFYGLIICLYLIQQS